MEGTESAANSRKSSRAGSMIPSATFDFAPSRGARATDAVPRIREHGATILSPLNARGVFRLLAANPPHCPALGLSRRQSESFQSRHSLRLRFAPVRRETESPFRPTTPPAASAAPPFVEVAAPAMACFVPRTATPRQSSRREESLPAPNHLRAAATRSAEHAHSESKPSELVANLSGESRRLAGSASVSARTQTAQSE